MRASSQRRPPLNKTPSLLRGRLPDSQVFAESEGFEPPEAFTSTVFKTAALNHSANSPTYFTFLSERITKVVKKIYSAKFFLVFRLFFALSAFGLLGWGRFRLLTFYLSVLGEKLVLEENEVEGAHGHAAVSKIEDRFEKLERAASQPRHPVGPSGVDNREIEHIHHFAEEEWGVMTSEGSHGVWC